MAATEPVHLDVTLWKSRSSDGSGTAVGPSLHVKAFCILLFSADIANSFIIKVYGVLVSHGRSFSTSNRGN